MNVRKSLTMLGLATGFFLFAHTASPAQISIPFGAEPVCPYGYFDYAPYNCAPYGFYGPDWFIGGAFIGAGHWYHGHQGFYGHVDNRYDPHHGYAGPFPDRGEQPFNHFHGNEARDFQGHVGNAGHEAGNEHAAGHVGGGGGRSGGGRR
jgi:hypothetical protein